ncbi:immunoglobulin domain-containing protein oig-4 [Folsomia candida]|uniref:Muscle M-line assembly protein unc-89 n=1 Tax=Folsomia candida TaxID=158441 RepID=A0A226F1V6_FOLCA|nr:immunoglobulin domain-containing protein oig-4 [Folsomia candida]OXA62926.1 Muscle M-line assembly protein unc-89 [Folsomia candida]
MRLIFIVGNILLLLGMMTVWVEGQRGGRGRSKGRKGGLSTSLRVPPGGQWRDPDTAKYYTNPKGAKITKASHFDLEYVLGHKVSFLCEAKGSPRPQITWFKDGIELYYHGFLQVHEWRHGDEKIKSKMEIDPATQMDAGIYECYADNKYAVDKRTFRTDFITVFD